MKTGSFRNVASFASALGAKIHQIHKAASRNPNLVKIFGNIKSNKTLGSLF
jgi:hypothetical protein